MIEKIDSLPHGTKVPVGKRYEIDGKVYGAGASPTTRKKVVISQVSAPTLEKKEAVNEL